MEKNSRFDNIQYLRFFAAFAVVVLHVGYYWQSRINQDFKIYTWGSSGVRIFFVISGFVIMFSVQSVIVRGQSSLAFIKNRAVRILPGYWLSVLMKFIIVLVLPAAALNSDIRFWYFTKSLFLFPAYDKNGIMQPFLGVAWTLMYEAFFYIICAILIKFKINVPKGVVTSILLLYFMHWIFDFEGVLWYDFLTNPVILDFCAGVVIYKYRNDLMMFSQKAIFFSSMVGVAYLFLPGPKFSYYSFLGSLLTTFSSALIVACAVRTKNIFNCSVGGVFSELGNASYVLYLVHPIVGPALVVAAGYFYSKNVPVFILIPVVVFACIVFSVLIYKKIEMPLIAKIKNQIN